MFSLYLLFFVDTCLLRYISLFYLLENFQLSAAQPSVSAYTELPAAVEQYVDYVVFGLLACPGLLLTEPMALELLSIVTKHRLVIGVTRDIVSVRNDFIVAFLKSKIKFDCC